MLESKFLLLKQMAALDKLTGIMRRVEAAKRSRRFNHWKTRVNELKIMENFQDADKNFREVGEQLEQTALKLPALSLICVGVYKMSQVKWRMAEMMMRQWYRWYMAATDQEEKRAQHLNGAAKQLYKALLPCAQECAAYKKWIAFVKHHRGVHAKVAASILNFRLADEKMKHVARLMKKSHMFRRYQTWRDFTRSVQT